MRHRIVVCFAVVIGMLVMASAQARPIPLVKSSAMNTSTFTPQIVGNGVYPATSSGCYPTVPADIPFRPTSGIFLTAPIVVGVYWPGAQSAEYRVHTLFPDFVTDLFNGPYWSAVMPQYLGSAHGVYQQSIDITTLLTHAPSTTVRVRDIAGELVAQQKAGVLPAPDSHGNTIYVVHFPPGITIADSTYRYPGSSGDTLTHVSIGTSCNQFCAYHDFYFDLSEPRYFPFVVMPDISQGAGCLAGCGIGTPFDRYTEVLSHELFEAATDPYAAGWLNSCAAGGGEEIADVCEEVLFHMPRRTSTPGTSVCPNRWAMNSVFSNAAWNPANANGCVVADAATQDCTAGVVPDNSLAATLELSAPSPNPAVNGTRLRYSLPFVSLVRMDVLDVAGRQVAVLARQVEGPGAHSAAWDGRDASGSRVSAGLYFVRLEAAGQVLSQRIALDR
jgi:hypothetical protein